MRPFNQSFADLLPVQTVGVMGDQQTYDYTPLPRASLKTGAA
jgi:GMP synthase PP-ATPase subunit